MFKSTDLEYIGELQVSVKCLDSCGDDYPTSQILQRFTGVNSSSSGITVIPGRNLNCLKLSNAILEKTLSTPISRANIGFGLKVDYPYNLGSGPIPILALMSSSNPSSLINSQLIVYVWPDGTISLLPTNSNSSLVSSPGLFSFGKGWQYLEISAGGDSVSSTGTCVYLNGSLIIGPVRMTSALVSGYYRNSGPTNDYTSLDTFRFIGNLNSNTYIDDLYISDFAASYSRGRLGDVSLTLLLPSSGGTLNGWSPLPTGPDYTIVGKTYLDSSTYVYSPSGATVATSGGSDTYLVTGIPTGSTIYSVQANTMARYEPSVAAVGSGAIQTFCILSSTNYAFSNIVPTQNFIYYFGIQDFDPSSSPPFSWSPSQLNGLEIGVKNTGLSVVAVGL